MPIDYNLATTYEDYTIVEPEDRKKSFGQKDHVRWYGCDYPDRLRGAGYDVDEVDYYNELGDELQKKYGLMKGEIIYHCTKNN